MNPLTEFKTTILPLLAALTLLCFALSPAAQAVLPAPDGGYPNFNTAEGDFALFSLTTGFHNTAVGFEALYGNTSGSSNTANGLQALFFNATGNDNTANGEFALLSNRSGSNNTANGYLALSQNDADENTATGGNALESNTTGHDNTATGFAALQNNATGLFNTATGTGALFSNTTASNGTANGVNALADNTIGDNNTATGFDALSSNTTGDANTANGAGALLNNTTGNTNIALGTSAGHNLTTGDNNIDIGNDGVAGEANTIRIGTVGTQTSIYLAGVMGRILPRGVAVVVNENGQLGIKTSSARFKDEIKPMDKASEAILALKPVTFRYEKQIDPEGTPQFGLVAEDVEKVNPDLVVRDPNAKPYTVRYEAVNAMLLNEFIKEHRKVEKLEAALAQQRKDFQTSTAQQEKEITDLTTSLREQAAQIQKVSAELAVANSSRGEPEVTKHAPQLADNHQ